MKKAGIFILLMMMLFITVNSLMAFQDISGGWLYRFSDAEVVDFTKEDYATWETTALPVFLKPGKGEGKYLFLYRKFELLPQSGVSFHLVLGGVNEVDEVFLNGVKIGQMGSFPPSFNPASGRLRIYPLPDSLLFGANELFIRVYGEGESYGIIRGPVGIFNTDELEKELLISTAPHNSISEVVVGNGLALARYNIEKKIITYFSPHIYRDSIAASRIKKASLLIVTPDSSVDMQSLGVIQEGYLPSTMIFHQSLQSSKFQLDIYLFSPQYRQEPLLVFLARIKGENVLPYKIDLQMESASEKLAWREEFYRRGQEEAFLVVVVGWSEAGLESAQRRVNLFLREYPYFSSLKKEIRWWQEWHEKTLLPPELGESCRRLYLQSLSLIKISQSRDRNPGNGQIVATLDPSGKNYTVALDALYATSALIKSGHIPEARKTLLFFLQARENRFESYTYQNQDLGIKSKYKISVYAYDGSGREYTPEKDDGAVIISLSSWGLFLSVFREYIDVTGDEEFLKEHWRVLINQIGEPILRNIDDRGLIRRESGPYRVFVPGEQFSYTTAACARGLMDAAWLAHRLNDQVNARRFEEAAFKLQKNLLELFVDPYNVIFKEKLAKNLPQNYLGLFSTEVLNWLIPVENPYFNGTLKAFDKYLHLPYTGHGFMGSAWFQNNFENEYIPMELRLLSTYKKAGMDNEYDRLLEWILAQSRMNYYLIPEFYHNKSADYYGDYPMIGLGAGAFIISMW